MTDRHPPRRVRPPGAASILAARSSRAGAVPAPVLRALTLCALAFSAPAGSALGAGSAQTRPGQTQPGQTQPEKSANPLDKNQTPAEAAAHGSKAFGTFDIYSPLHCSQDALHRVVSSGLIPDDRVMGTNVLGQPITAGGYVTTVRDSIDRVMKRLKDNGDTVVGARHVCVGLADFGEKGPNAVSLEQGYIFADPRLVNLVNSLPDRTMFSLDMMHVHELAHQLQYWHGNPFTGEETVRRTELAADCVASTLIAMQWKEPWTIKMSADGVVAAAVSVGDLEFKDPGHHGTPVERKTVSSYGVGLAISRLEASSKGWVSKDLLQRCNEFILARDKEFGANWPDRPIVAAPR